MIDTHAHLTDPSFANDLSQVLDRATEKGVHTIICVSENATDAESVLRLHSQHPTRIQPAIGLHPEQATKLLPESLRVELERIQSLVSRHSDVIVAIAEVGLDYKPHVLSQSPLNPDAAKRMQQDAFKAQMTIAANLQLPISVHSRGAGHHALRMICEHEQTVATCMHAFDGRAVYAERALDTVHNNGLLYFSVPPSVVRDDAFTKLVRRLPLERLMLESDSPALAACKNERNEPAEIERALHMIAGLKACSVEHCKEILTRNTLDLFNRLKKPV